MKLVDMKLSKEEIAKDYAQPSIASGQPEYPYGLKISLDAEALAKLGIDVKKLQVGAGMTLEAACEVCSISQYESVDSGERQDMSLQIVKMAVKPGPVDQQSADKKLYGG